MKDISKLINETFLKMVDTKEYLKFLEFCSRGNISRYSPENQLLIYNQKPDAELLVPFDNWAKVGRYPKKNTGINVYQSEMYNVGAKYVFDIKDTSGNAFNGYIKVEASEHDYINSLFKDRGENLGKSIENLTRTYVRGNIKLENMGFFTSDMLGEMIEDISAYLVKKHCGIECSLSDETINRLDMLKEFTQFKTYFAFVQPKIQEISRGIIRGIDVAVYRKREGKEYGNDIRRNSEEQSYDRRADSRVNEYNDGDRSNEVSGTGRSEVPNDRERDNFENRNSGKSGSDIREGELQGTVLVDDGNRGNVTIHSEESGRSERVEESDRNEGTGEDEHRLSEGYNGEHQIEKSGETDGGRDDSDGSIISSTDERSVEDTIYDDEGMLNGTSFTVDGINMAIEVEADENEDELNKITKPDFKLYEYKQGKVKDEYVTAFLKKGTTFENGKFRIYDASKTYTLDALANFIKHEYGVGGSSWHIEGYGLKGYNTYSSSGKGRGITFEWIDEDGHFEGTVTWKNAAEKCLELINSDEYLSENEKEEYEEYQIERLSKELGNDALKYDKKVNGKLEQAEASSPVKKDIPDALFEEFIMHIDALNKHSVASVVENKEKKDALRDIKMYYGLGFGGEIENSSFTNAMYRPLDEGIRISWFDGEKECYDEKSYLAVFNKVIGLVSENRYITELDKAVWENFEKNSVVRDLFEEQQEKSVSVEDTEDIKNVIEAGSEVTDGEKKYTVYDSNSKDTTLVAKDGSEVIQVSSDTIKENRLLRGESSTYHYSDDWKMTTGSDKVRFRANIDAIKLLKQIEAESRYATTEEQDVLSHYVGWGGLSSAFDENNTSWSEEYKELKSLLSESEYKAARGSVTDSFYTPRKVIDGVYEALKHMGFKGGNILEPSCGVGNFYNAMPEDILKSSRLYGVELDSISGRIAQLLHPEANIKVMGFEKADLEDNFYDLVIGNVPFGSFKVYDSKYKNQNFLIHDYFFAKALDKVAPGGLVCFITSKGTLDKENPKVRKYLAERADLIGAIRLPNTTFKDSANTEATSDLIILQKKDSPIISEPDWCYLGYINDDIPCNQYFVDNPDMLLGNMEKDTSRFGKDKAITYLAPRVDEPLGESIKNAVKNLPENIVSERNNELLDEDVSKSNEVLPADPTVKNHTFTVIDDKIFLRENSNMYLYVPKNKTMGERIKGMCNIRVLFHELIDVQVRNCSDFELQETQNKLNTAYDKFVKKYGYINHSANKSAFLDDIEYPFLCSLEEKREEEYVKADIFSKRTIKPYTPKDRADSSIDALHMVLNETGRIDIEKILKLYPVSFEELKKDLLGIMFRDPTEMVEDDEYSGYVPADEYLSGNVRKKLAQAKEVAEKDVSFKYNVERLQEVQPKDLEADEISVRIGTIWISKEDYREFLLEKLNLNSSRDSSKLELNYFTATNTFNIPTKNVNAYFNKVYLTDTYGTNRMNALEIFENLLNSREVTVRDRVEDENGNTRYVVNQDETLLAREKAALLENEFENWIFSDIDRREKYVKYYNETFNSVVNRTYDGSYMEYPNMNPNISLRPHQKNMVCRAVMGGNALAAHCVGAGKTYEMATICQEWKRLGLANKPMIVTPNHLVGQFASEYQNLFPSANLLVATTKDFEKRNRRRFISKIATGDYDCVIIGHSQFEKIGLSAERQINYLEEEKKVIMLGIEEIKEQKGERWTIKQQEAQLKSLNARLEKLRNADYKEDFITFEELGVDALLLDEAHEYKNLDFTTKMGRVAGINPIGSKKAYDMFLKVQYIQELTPGRNVVFATGTPISNSMAEMYIMQKYLQADRLKELGLYHFDAWAANFGKVETAMELAPEGGTYREKTRFAKFVNLPELISLYKEFADVQMADMLDLNVPKLKNDKFTVVECEPNEEQLSLMEDIQNRARDIQNGMVDPSIDNMLKICHDGKLLATDIRLVDEFGENYDDSKLNVCVDNVVSKYHEYDSDKGTQIIFSDIGVPGGANAEKFGVYEYLKERMIEKGIPADEICFIHDAKDSKAREQMFADMRNGTKRVIIGSTSKMGTGTNIQKRLCAMHEIDCPWRPSDVEQREGRIIRQGNMFPEVEVFRYVTKKTFDAYNWSIIVRKQKFISQIMTSKDVARTCEDIDESVMSYEEVMAAATDNPLIKEKIELDNKIQKLELIKTSFDRNKWKLETKIKRYFPEEILNVTQLKEKLKEDIELRNKSLMFKDKNKTETVDENTPIITNDPAEDKGNFLIELCGKTFDSRKDAGTYLLKQREGMQIGEEKSVGTFCGFEVLISKDYHWGELDYVAILRGSHEYNCDIFNEPVGTMVRLTNLLKGLDGKYEVAEEKLKGLNSDLVLAKAEYEKEFPQQEELNTLKRRQVVVNDLLTATDDKAAPVENEALSAKAKSI